MQPAAGGGAFLKLDRDVLVQIVGYAGAAGGVAATFAALAQVDDLTETGAFVAMLVVTAVLIAAGAWLRGIRVTAYERMRSVLWFGAVQSWTLAVQLFVTSIAELTGRTALVVSALLIALLAGALWVPLRRTLQHLALFLGVLGLVIALVFPEPSPFEPPNFILTALVVWIFGVGWAFLGLRAVIAPPRTGLLLGVIAAIIGPLAFSEARLVGELLSLATACVGIALGERLDDRAVSGLGIVGVLLVTIVVVVEHLGDSTGSTIAALVGGLLLLGGALFAARGAQRRPPQAAPLVPVPPPPTP